MGRIFEVWDALRGESQPDATVGVCGHTSELVLAVQMLKQFLLLPPLFLRKLAEFSPLALPRGAGLARLGRNFSSFHAHQSTEFSCLTT